MRRDRYRRKALRIKAARFRLDRTEFDARWWYR